MATPESATAVSLSNARSHHGYSRVRIPRWKRCLYEKPADQLPEGAVLCRAWMTKIEGRKLWVAGRIEDENGESCMTGKGLLLKGGRVKL